MREILEPLIGPLRILAYIVLAALSLSLIGHLVLFGYFLANGIYPFDLLTHGTPLSGIYLLFGFFYFGLAFSFYGWAAAIYCEKRGKPIPFPTAPLKFLGAISHALAVLGYAVTFIPRGANETKNTIRLREIFDAASGGDNFTLLISIGGTLLFLICLAALIGSLYVGEFRGFMVGRSLPMLAIFLALMASPVSFSLVTALALRTWGIGGGLPAKIELSDAKVVSGSLVLLGPTDIYLKDASKRTEVTVLRREVVRRIDIERESWTR
jgi:hypothetical protein